MNIIQKFFYNLTKEYTENKEKKEKNWKELWEYIEAKETQLRSEQWDNATECLLIASCRSFSVDTFTVKE